jgi:hypothetical protein
MNVFRLLILVVGDHAAVYTAKLALPRRNPIVARRRLRLSRHAEWNGSRHRPLDVDFLGRAGTGCHLGRKSPDDCAYESRRVWSTRKAASTGQ